MGELFKKASGIDRDAALKESAGVKRLNAFSNLYELQTLTNLLNVDFEKILFADDTFCTKILLSNVEKIRFENEFARLKAKQKPIK